MANRLIKESSPYLLQHANNPVDWYPWGVEALEKAKRENKLLLISIGYSACHWCHVMERESFENDAIAHLMNEHFVCIKVDREERADIDQIYMQAVQLMTGRGGWPLNCFALPDGRPVYGGTYFPSAQWTNILEALSKAFQETPDKFSEYAEKLTPELHDPIIKLDPENQVPFESILTRSIEIIKKQFDWEFGGFKGAPKFPLPGALEFLLETAVLNKDEAIQNFVFLTLNKMADSGLYDQLGGGFARYSVDAQWKVPHFEKMLYDNAQLISLYSKAYQYKKEARFKEIIEESLAYIQREMTNEYAGFYSAQDADSEGIEGKFYCWTKEELAAILGKDTELFERYFQCVSNGNWENGLNILYPVANTTEICKAYQLTNSELESKIHSLKKKLFTERSKRVYPALDDKSISAWNGIMLYAFVDGFKALGDPEYLKSAEKAAGFLENLMDDEGRIKRIFKENVIKIEGFLDDYAFSIKAFISLYQITFNPKYLNLAKKLNDFTMVHFRDEKSKLFFYTSDESQNLITRKKELSDNVIPSSNSAMAHNLFDLGTLLSEDKYIQDSKEMLNQILTQIPKGREYFTNWGRLLFRFLHSSTEVVVMGDDCENIAHQLQKEYYPLSYFVGSKTKAYLPLMENRLVFGDTQIYVCKNKSCQLPTNNIEEAIQTIRETN